MLSSPLILILDSFKTRREKRLEKVLNLFFFLGNGSGASKEVALKHALNAALSAAKVSSVKSLLTNAVYLQDSMVELFGLKIYGSPW